MVTEQGIIKHLVPGAERGVQLRPSNLLTQTLNSCAQPDWPCFHQQSEGCLQTMAPLQGMSFLLPLLAMQMPTFSYNALQLVGYTKRSVKPGP